MFVDSHCHLDYLAADAPLDGPVARAQAARVETLLTISTKLSTFPQVRAIAERYPNVYCSIGVHPHEAAAEGQSDPAALIAGASHDKVIGIGETGLDFYYEHSPRQAQADSFRTHLSAARETGLPVIVHTRDADRETVSILREETSKGAIPGVIHCFTAGSELAKAALELGFYISVAGIVTFKKADALRLTVAEVPLDRLLIETDSPYLAPVPLRGKKNEPANVVHTARALAELKGVTIDVLATTTSDNFYRLFSRARRPSEP